MLKPAGRPRVLVLVLLLVTFGLYLTLTSRTMQYDEAYTLRHFAANPGIALLSYTEPNNHMLHSLLVWGTTTLGGTTQVAVRFPALALALLSVAMLYRVGRRLAGWQAGIVAAVFLATNGVFADYATNARGYTLAVFLTLALIDQAFLSPPKHTRRYRYGLILTCAALILTLPTMALLIAGVFLWLLWRARSRRVYLLALPPLVIGSLTGAIFYLPAAAAGSLARNAGRFGYRDLSPLISEWLVMIFGTPVTGVVLMACCMGGCLFLLMRWRDVLLAQMILSVAGTAMALALGQYLLLGQVFYGRNYLYLLPLVCLTAAVGLTAVSRKAGVILAALLFWIAVFPLNTTLNAETPVDQVLARFDRLLTPSDMILVGNFADEPIFYTLQQRGQWERLLLDTNKQRLIVVTQVGDALADLIAVYQLEPYLNECLPSEDAGWLPLIVYECSFQ